MDHVSVAGTNAHLYRDSAFRRVAQEMRRHRFSRSHDLDVSPTVSATIRAGGSFTPVYGSRRVSPEYLVLIDRATFRDQQTQLEDTLISRLVEDNVFVDRYYFTGDPRVCRKDDPKAPRLKLRDLDASPRTLPHTFYGRSWTDRSVNRETATVAGILFNLDRPRPVD